MLGTYKKPAEDDSEALEREAEMLRLVARLASDLQASDPYRQPTKQVSLTVNEEFDGLVVALAGIWQTRDRQEWHASDVYRWLLANAIKLTVKRCLEEAERLDAMAFSSDIGEWRRPAWEVCDPVMPRRLPHKLRYSRRR